MNMHRVKSTAIAVSVAVGLAFCVATPPNIVTAEAPHALTTAQTEATLTAFLDAVYLGQPIEAFLADDVVVSLVGGPELIGREAAGQTIDGLMDVTFDRAATVTTVIIDGGQAAVTTELGSAPSGAFVRPTPIGQSITVPYVVVYDLSDGQITRLRIFGLQAGLVQQILAMPAATTSEVDDTRYRPGQPH